MTDTAVQLYKVDPNQFIKNRLLFILTLVILLARVVVMRVMPPVLTSYGINQVQVGVYAGVGVVVISYLISAVLAVWSYIAARNLQTLGVKGLLHHPVLTILWYFIPVVSWVLPVFAMWEIWRASDPQILDERGWKGSRRNNGLVILWWLAVLLTKWQFSIADGLLQMLVDQISARGFVVAYDYVMYGIDFLIFAIISYTLFEVNRRQKRKLEALTH